MVLKALSFKYSSSCNTIFYLALEGILLLESILGEPMFNEEEMALKTDKGSEFILAGQAEIRDDGTRRTRLFYCDPMASWQKDSLENIHILI